MAYSIVYGLILIGVACASCIEYGPLPLSTTNNTYERATVIANPIPVATRDECGVSVTYHL